MWTLASWEVAQQLADQATSQRQRPSLEGTGEVLAADQDERVVVLMTGGGLGLHGLAQRWPDQF